MADGPRPVEIQGLTFLATSDGYLLESEVRRHVDALVERVNGLERENAELRWRLDHVEALKRLAEATVAKADELAATIEAEARQRADTLLAQCEAAIEERRRRLEAALAAEQAAAQARVAQLQAALEETVQTLARALQAVGAPALELAAPAPGPSGALPAATPVEPLPAGATEPAGDLGPPYGGWDLEANARPAAVEPEASGAGPPAIAAQAGSPVGSPSIYAARGSTESLLPAKEMSARRDAAEPALAAVPPPVSAGPAIEDRAGEPGRASMEAAEAAPPAAAELTDSASLEIDMRPVRSFADLARVTKLLGRIAPGAQPVDLNLPQHRALFSVRGTDPRVLVAELQEALPEARVLQQEGRIDVLLDERA